MPTTLAGLALYVLTLSPGLAFVFAREGHRPTVRRSVFRETATVILVSAVCDAIVAAGVAFASFFWPELFAVLRRLAIEDQPFIAGHLAALFLITCGLIVVATVLGWLAGTKRIHTLISRRAWGASLIERDASAWGVAFDLGEVTDRVLVGVQLKSGWWLEGVLYAFDNAGDADPHRTITLTGDLKSRAPASDQLNAISGYGTLIVEAGDIEYVLVGYEAAGPAGSAQQS